jgi:ABC-type uncharacterized transport system permease subunit
MGRILAFLLGGFALALYGPNAFMTAEQWASYSDWWTKTLGEGWYTTLFKVGPGIFAGLALLLLAVRGSESDSR